MALMLGTVACAGDAVAGDPAAAENLAAPFGPPVDDERVYLHALLDEFEVRRAEGMDSGRWQGEAWAGTDTNRLWVKSEGEIVRDGEVTHGQHELSYDHPITAYFDLQAGMRLDLDSGPTRRWAALGIEGLAPYFIHLSASAYAGGGARYAARLLATDDLLVTQRLILQTQLEVNAYSRADPARGVDGGVADLEFGMRLRYEIKKKFAPYAGVAYRRNKAAAVNGALFAVGLRLWF